MENNNGKGIFYGVIGVATLVVAIIGATFAFFSATANVAGANQAAANSVSLADTLTITGTAQFGTAMIPVTSTEMYKSYALNGTNHCKGYSATSIVDGNPMTGAPLYDLCSTYDFTITNSATVAQTVYFTFTASTNTFGANGNLKYCIYRQNQVSAGGAGELVACKKVPTTEAADTNVFNDIIPAKVDSTNGSQSYTMILYIEEAGEQTAVDAGKAFAGSITASTAGGEAKVTGVVSTLSSNE